MLRTILIDPDGDAREGGAALIDEWQAMPNTWLWLDLYDEPATSERELLLALGCHDLAISDAQRLRHPPKLETFEAFTFLLYRGFRQFDDDLNVETIQLAFWIGDRLLITRRNGPSFGVSALWDHPRRADWVRRPALLAMRVIVASANGYIQGVLQFEQTLSELEDSMLKHANDELMQKLVLYRSRLRQLMRVFSYHERALAQLLHHPTAQLDMGDGEVPHQIQDAYEKMERLNSLTTMYHELCGDLLDGYLNITSHRLNNTMRVLTVITAVFVPISFLAGIYGMNFEVMPELSHPRGYFMLLGVMAMIATSLLALFRYNKWI